MECKPGSFRSDALALPLESPTLNSGYFSVHINFWHFWGRVFEGWRQKQLKKDWPLIFLSLNLPASTFLGETPRMGPLSLEALELPTLQGPLLDPLVISFDSSSRCQLVCGRTIASRRQVSDKNRPCGKVWWSLKALQSFFVAREERHFHLSRSQTLM